MTKSLAMLTLGLSLFLSGCGFHLRTSQVELGNKFPVMVLQRSGSHTFHQALQRALTIASTQVIVDPCADADIPRLTIVSMQTTQQPLVYGPDSELRRERLRMSVRFSFANPTPTEIDLYSVRDRQLNSNQYLGDNAEKSMIEQEMQADIIDQLLQYLESRRF
ncbi:MAG: LPS assembly lipoprotein LptE [Candidatus Berkiella sp.]